MKNLQQPQREDPANRFWISVSDLMVGIIFIFLVVIMVFSVQFKKEQKEFVAVKNELLQPAQTSLHILQKLQQLLRKSGLEVEIYPEEGILRLTEKTLSFPVAKAVPGAEHLAHVGILARALTTVLPCFSRRGAGEEARGGAAFTGQSANPEAAAVPAWCGSQGSEAIAELACDRSVSGSIDTVMIEGHTDAMAVKATAEYLDNLALSAARATTVLRFLKLCDPQLGQLVNKKNQPLLGVSGYSDLRPVIRNAPLDPRNRRIDIRLVMDFAENALKSSPAFSRAETKLGSEKKQ